MPGCLDWSFSIDWLSKCINYTAKHTVAYRNLYNSSGCLYSITFIDILMISQKNSTYVVLFQVQNHSVYF